VLLSWGFFAGVRVLMGCLADLARELNASARLVTVLVWDTITIKARKYWLYVLTELKNRDVRPTFRRSSATG
jgi:hypothetical protein